LTVLEQVFEQLIDCPMPQKGLAKDYAKLVRIWHHTVRQMAHSPSLDWRISSFWNMADFLLWQTAPLLGKTQIEIANKQRDQIMQAIRERDAKRSEELMFNHVFSKPSRVGILPEESTNR
ncbi:MAG: FCD domain-containing protein, partial [Alteromonas oceani]